MNTKNIFCFMAVAALAFLLVFSASCATKVAENTTDGNNQPGEGLVFLSKRAYISEAGLPTVVGELQNSGNSSITNILIAASFYCSKGNEVGGGENMAAISDYPEVEVLAPGEKSPFKVGLTAEELANLPNFDVDSIKKYTVELSSYNTTEESLYRSFEVTQSGGELDSVTGYYKVTGGIKNIGTETAEQIKIVGTFYDNQPNIIEVIHTYLREPLVPGGEAQFELTVLDQYISERIKTYDIEAVEFEES